MHHVFRETVLLCHTSFLKCQQNLETGDFLIFFTDGITEAPSKENPEHLYMETGRLENLAEDFTSDMKAEAMIDAIISDVREFSGAMEQSDDMTVVVVKVLDAEPSG